jgi:hypothetical protein
MAHLTGFGTHTQQAALRLVRENEAVRSSGLVSFCGHCGARSEVDKGSRVCPDCRLGLMLEADADAAPSVGDAFLVFDNYLSVCAASVEAERLLSTREMDLVHRHLSEVLVPADVEAQSTSKLATALLSATRGDHTTRQLLVRPANTFGVRLSALIACCGPPSAALVVLR